MTLVERQRILVSIAIPAFNAGATLRDTLRSVLAQTHPTLDIVVVDDGSTDDTAEVAASFGERVRLIRQPNAGISRTRNTSLQAARGEFIALLDADDLCEPERIAVQLEYMLRNPNLLLCSSDFSGFDDTGILAHSYCGHYYSRCSTAQGEPRARYPMRGELDISDCLVEFPQQQQRVPTLQGQVYDELVLGNFIHPPTVMIRRDTIDKVGMFDPRFRIGCEWEWLTRVARAGPVGYLDRPLLRYRRSPTQVTHDPQTSLDALHVAQLLHARDPSIRQRAPRAVRRHLGGLCVDAAYALSETQPTTALRLLATGALRYHTVRRGSLAALVRLSLPTWLLQAMRQARRRLRRKRVSMV